MTDQQIAEMTEADLTEFARRHFAEHPDDIARDVFKAIRDSGYTGILQGFQVHEGRLSGSSGPSNIKGR